MSLEDELTDLPDLPPHVLAQIEKDFSKPVTDFHGRDKDLLQRVMIATVFEAEEKRIELLNNLISEELYMAAVEIAVKQYQDGLKKTYSTYEDAIQAFDEARNEGYAPYAALSYMGLQASDDETGLMIARSIRGTGNTRPGSQAPKDV